MATKSVRGGGKM